jgi:CBS domain-containing protein
MTESIMTEKLARRGLRVSNDYAVDPFRTVPVSAIMTTDVETISATATVGEARDRLARGPHGAYPIVDDQERCVGIVARGDLLRHDAPVEDRALDHASRDIVSVAAGDMAISALHCMVEEHIEHVPVLDGDGHLVGICTRTDLLRVRAGQLDLERHQPGWKPRRR